MNNRLKTATRIILLGFCFWSINSFGQNLVTRNTAIDLTGFDVDHLGNSYFLYNTTLVKYNKTGQETSRFARPDLGAITQFSVFDPMRILLYYNQVNQVWILDNQLNPKYEVVNLFDFQKFDVPSVALADENNLWLYDQIDDCLHRYDLKFASIKLSSQPITPLIGFELEVSLLRAHPNGLVLLSNKGLAFFDNLGNFVFFWSHSNLNDVHWHGIFWIASSNNHFYKIDTNSQLVEEINIPCCKETYSYWASDKKSIWFWHNRLKECDLQELSEERTK